VTVEGVRKAAAALVGVAVRTPLAEAPFLSRLAGQRVYLKHEELQPIGAFKLRGAMTAAARLAPEVRARGLVTSSSGNHGQAIAYAAKHYGVRAVVVMPGQTSKVKIAGVEKHGGTVVFAGERRSPEQMARAEQIAREEGLVLIPPYDHPDVIDGQGTIGLEIAEDGPEITDVATPVSGGGLLSGVCLGVDAVRPGIRVWAVEPAGAAKLSAATAAGRPVSVGHVDTICDGLRTPTVGELTWPIIRDRIAGVVTVTDDEVVQAMRLLEKELGVVIEPSGATTVAAVMAKKLRPAGSMALVITGQNVDRETFQKLVAA
jgi:threonine dehydratase